MVMYIIAFSEGKMGGNQGRAQLWILLYASMNGYE